MSTVAEMQLMRRQLKQNPTENVRFVTWDQVGQAVEGTVVEFTKDVQGEFGSFDELKLDTGSETLSIRCPADLKRILRHNEEVVVAGARLAIRYTGEVKFSKSMARKKFEVELVEPAKAA